MKDLLHVHFSMDRLILSLSLLHVVTCNVYYVIPDDHNTTCNRCHNLQYYQLNISEYFTAYTEIVFFPGLHHLYSNLIIQNVHNISLIGSRVNGSTLETVIQFVKLVSIVMNNVTNLTVKNLVISTCTTTSGTPCSLFYLINKTTTKHYLRKQYYPHKQYSSVIIEDCKNILMDHLQLTKVHDDIEYSLVIANILGYSLISNILCHNIRIHYNETTMEKQNSTLSIDHYGMQNRYDEKFSVAISMQQISYRVVVRLSNTTIGYKRNVFMLIEHMSNVSVVIITNCHFQFNYNQLFTTAMSRIVFYNHSYTYLDTSKRIEGNLYFLIANFYTIHYHFLL